MVRGGPVTTIMRNAGHESVRFRESGDHRQQEVTAEPEPPTVTVHTASSGLYQSLATRQEAGRGRDQVM